jgi:hypothetical protein
LSGRGLLKEAIDEYRLALALRPGWAALSDELREIETRQKRGADVADAAKARAREHALPGLDRPEARQPLGRSFAAAACAQAYQALAGRGINSLRRLVPDDRHLDLHDVG